MTAEQMELVAENKLFDNLTVRDYNKKEGMKLKSRLFFIMEIISGSGLDKMVI